MKLSCFVKVNKKVDEKKIIKEIHDSCQQSNSPKLKFLFSHFRINPNFIYSDVLDQITNVQGGAEHSSSLGLQINNNLHNINNLSNPIPQSQISFSSLNIFDPISARRNLNNANRNISSRYNSNILSNSNAKDKVFINKSSELTAGAGNFIIAAVYKF